MLVLLRPGILLITFVSGTLLGMVIAAGGHMCLPATPLPPRAAIGLQHPAVWSLPVSPSR
jgi:hypothetical protein